MTLGWPQLTYLAIVLLGLGIAMAEHGKPKTGTESFWMTLVSHAGVLWLLWAGGFFGGVE